MKAVRVHQFGGPEVMVYEDIDELPAPASDEALVDVAVIGINYSDTTFRRGSPGHLGDIGLPLIPGHEGAGVVAAVGVGVKDVKIGDRVVYSAQHRRGTYKEKMLLKAADLVAVPPDLELKFAVAALNQGQTAHYLSHDAHPIKAGEHVLIHAGAGGVGSNLIQMAKMLGATVYTTVSSETKAEFVRSIGADHVINYAKVDFIDAIKAATKGRGVDVAYDGIGGESIAKTLGALRIKGHLVSFGQASGGHVPLEWPPHGPSSFYLSKHIGPDYKSRDRVCEVFDWVRSGKLKVHIFREYKLADAAKAHSDLEGRRSIGKLLLIP